MHRSFPRRDRAAVLGLILLATCRHEAGERVVAPAARLDAAPGRGSSRDEPDGWYEGSRTLYYGIPARVRFQPPDRRLARRVWTLLERIDDVFNAYRADSEVGRLNAAEGGTSVEISEDLASALRLSLQVHLTTGGAFDPTVGPVRRLWQGAAKAGRPPSRAQLAVAMQQVGADGLQLCRRRLWLPPSGVQLDLGGMVKGIAVDRAIDTLIRGGARSALVMLGGETAAYGLNPRGVGHRLGVQHPLDGRRIWTAIEAPSDGLSAATSGNRFNPVRVGGRSYYHIVDPRTGQPASTDILQVTVVLPGVGRNGTADGLSTAAAVMGAARAIALVGQLGGQALILVRLPGQRIGEHKTRGWDDLAVKGRKPSALPPTTSR